MFLKSCTFSFRVNINEHPFFFFYNVIEIEPMTSAHYDCFLQLNQDTKFFYVGQTRT